MERKSKVLVYLPRKLYVELHERQLTNHVSYLVSRLLEEFLKTTDVRISWVEMESKAEQREYLERKLKEFLSRNGLSAGLEKPPELPTEPSKPPVQERTRPTHLPTEPPKSSVQGSSKEAYVVSKPKPVKEEPLPPEEDSGGDIDILKSLDNLW